MYFIIGICAVLTIKLLLLSGYILGKRNIGRIVATSIGFVIAVLSLSLLKISFVMIYIPIFTLALPLALYNLMQIKFTSKQSIIISAFVAILFSTIMFVMPFTIIWYLVIGLSVILVVSQLSGKYRFIW